MRYGWLEQLYRHRVPAKAGGLALQPPYSCRIEPLLDTLNQVLAEACATLPDELRSVVATELLTASATVRLATGTGMVEIFEFMTGKRGMAR